MSGRAAVVTGGASGIGAAVARRLRDRGVSVVIADLDQAGGASTANALGAIFVPCDVSSLDDQRRAIEACESTYGGLDVAFLNAGVANGGALDEPFDAEGYRRMLAVNIDGVAFGILAALPALRRRGGGDIIATASLAGLNPFPSDPVYTATKHAVVGLVRSVAPSLVEDNIRLNAICPGYADTAMLDPLRQDLADQGMPLLSTGAVADAVTAVLASRDTGQCWFVQPGRPAAPYAFRGVPGPRVS